MSSFQWATPRKAIEYYLDCHGIDEKTLWNAVADVKVKAQIMGVDFPSPYIGAILKLLHMHDKPDNHSYEHPIWISLWVDDIDTEIIGAPRNSARIGRPKKDNAANRRNYEIAIEVAQRLGDRRARSVSEAARQLISEGFQGITIGQSEAATIKKIQRAFSDIFRND